MSNSTYYRAGKALLNWSRLSTNMKARYGAWVAKSTASWAINFEVVVTHHNGRKLSEQPTYPFENKADAEECVGWWQDNNCIAEIKEV